MNLEYNTSLSNRDKGRKALKAGREAEKRVVRIIENVLDGMSASLSVRQATSMEDMGGEKTDVVISNLDGQKLKIQVSLHAKSKRARKRLIRKGVIPFNVAGKDQDDLTQEIRELVRGNFFDF